MQASYGNLLKVNAPEFFRRDDFAIWLNNASVSIPDPALPSRVATWHYPGPINEYSDVFVTYDNGEGSNSDMPEDIWQSLCRLCESYGVSDCVIWITNLGGQLSK